MEKNFEFLIIDDSEPVIAVYTQLLNQAGHIVHSLTSCDGALQHIISTKPDCVLCDLMLPGMDGMDFFHLVRKENNIKQPVFIVISAKHFEFDRRQALKAGVDAYLTKPINHATFAKEVVKIIHDKKLHHKK